MTVIRGEKVEQIAILTSTKELLFTDPRERGDDFFEEECSRSLQKGKEIGERLGYEKAVNENKALLGLLQKLSETMLEQQKRLLEQLKPELVEFCIAVCEKVLRKELSRPEALADMIHTLLKFATGNFQQETLQIILAPGDLEMLQNHLEHIQLDSGDILKVGLRADSLMKQGDCRIEAKSGLLNYEISRKLEELKANILQG